LVLSKCCLIPIRTDISDQSDQEQGIANMSPLGMIFTMNPTQPVYNPDGTPNLDAGMGNVKNPLIALIGTGETTDQTYQVQRYRSLTNANVNMQILPDLAIRSTFGLDYSDSKTFIWWAPESVDGEAYNGLGDHLTYTNIIKNASFIADYKKHLKNIIFRHWEVMKLKDPHSGDCRLHPKIIQPISCLNFQMASHWEQEVNCLPPI
jgi:hypothetical protein